MKNNKYKILVLSDLKESANLTLKSAFGLAKMIDGEIELFHVKSAADLVERESQLSAVRNINEQYVIADKKIKELLKPLAKDYNLKVKHKYASGNVKDEIESHITETKPDIIILGRRKSKALNFIGDNITDFILKKHEGAIVIASDKSILEPNGELTLGILNGIEKSLDRGLGKNLMEKTNASLKSFRIGPHANTKKQENIISGVKTVEYVFEDNPDVIKTLSNYVTKSNINLLCLDRNNSNSKTVNYTKDVIKKVNVSLLVT